MNEDIQELIQYNKLMLQQLKYQNEILTQMNIKFKHMLEAMSRIGENTE